VTILLGRVRSQRVTKQVTHFIPAPTENTTRLVTYCRLEFEPGDLELLDRIAGMPCEACMAVMPRSTDSRSIQ
jgi:hypothetical protein